MSDDELALEFIEEEALPDDTQVYQLEDGTLFYYSSRKLYVKMDGKEIVAPPLPYGFINYVGAHGNGLYFEASDKIYKATVSPEDAVIKVTCLRDKLQDEELHCRAVCTRVRDGKKFVYRLCDDPEKDGVHVEIPAEEKRLVLKAVYRKTAIFTKTKLHISRPSARRLNENVIVVELPIHQASTYPLLRDSFQFAYFTNGYDLFTLDMKTLQFLPHLSFGYFLDGKMNCRREIFSLVAVQNGEITVKSKRRDGDWLVTFQLPCDYA